jgi:hypothetical protein
MCAARLRLNLAALPHSAGVVAQHDEVVRRLRIVRDRGKAAATRCLSQLSSQRLLRNGDQPACRDDSRLPAAADLLRVRHIPVCVKDSGQHRRCTTERRELRRVEIDAEIGRRAGGGIIDSHVCAACGGEMSEQVGAWASTANKDVHRGHRSTRRRHVREPARCTFRFRRGFRPCARRLPAAPSRRRLAARHPPAVDTGC